MYYRDLETSAQAKQQHNRNQRDASRERLKKNASWNKANKSQPKKG